MRSQTPAHTLYALCLVGWITVLTVPASFADGLNPKLLAELENAPSRTQLRIARIIAAELDNERPSPDVEQRLVRFIVSSEHRSRPESAAVLRSLGPGSALTEYSALALARSLTPAGPEGAMGVLGAKVIGRLLLEYDSNRKLPAAAMDAIYAAIKPPNMVNPIAAISVVKAIPVSDPRFDSNVDALSSALQGDFPYVRSFATDALAHYASQGPLPPAAVAALSRTALTDSHMHVRLQAHSALLAVASVNRSPLVESLASELSRPTTALWRASSGHVGAENLRPRAIDLLAESVELPYPQHVIDALIAQTDRQHRTTLPYLRLAHQAAPLEDETAARLKALARRHDQAEVRQSIYDLLADPGAVEPVAEALRTMERGRTESERLEAAYRVERAYRVQPVSRAVATVAEQLLFSAGSRELRGVAARLVARGPGTFAARDERLLNALKTHSNDDEVRSAWFRLYGEDQMHLLVARHAADTAIAPWIRKRAVYHLGLRASPDAKLPRPAYERMVSAGERSSNYALNEAIIGTLTAWDEPVPLSLRLKNRRLQSRLLFYAYCALAILFAVASLMNLGRTVRVPLLAPAQAAKRALLVIAWVAMSLISLGLFVFAFAGFLGHNSAPKPAATLSMNLPLYGWMLVFLIYTGVLQGSGKRQAHPGAAA